MDNEDLSVAVDPHGKLKLTRPEDATPVAHAPDVSKSQSALQVDPASVRQALAEQSVEHEAEQLEIAQALEQASSAEPPESGALTVESPRDE